jgi:hypothetical protein
MPQGMKTAAYTTNASTPAYDFEITTYIPLRKLAALLSAKDEPVLMAGEVSIEDLAKLNAHWYESLFITFSIDKKSQGLKVHILAREAQQLVYPHSRIKRTFNTWSSFPSSCNQRMYALKPRRYVFTEIGETPSARSFWTQFIIPCFVGSCKIGSNALRTHR